MNSPKEDIRRRAKEVESEEFWSAAWWMNDSRAGSQASANKAADAKGPTETDQSKP